MQSRLPDCFQKGATMQINNSVNTNSYKPYQSSNNAKNDNTAENISSETTNYNELFKQKINELFNKVQNGETEPSFQIGARSFTQKEWDEFLEKFDSAEETVRQLMREAHEKRVAKREKEEQLEKDAESIENAANLLTSDTTSCTYPSENDTGNDIRYITWYTEEGIFCRKTGQSSGYEWYINFENREQYSRVLQFIGQFPTDYNMRFAADKNFWTDFLNGKINAQDFTQYIKNTDNAIYM